MTKLPINRRNILRAAGVGMTGTGVLQQAHAQRLSYRDEGDEMSTETWPMHQYDRGNTGVAQNNSGILDSPTTAWTSESNKDGVGGIVADSDHIYAGVGTNKGDNVDGKVLAVSIDDGTILWEKTLDRPIGASPAVVNGTLYVGTHEFESSYHSPREGHLYALDATSGNELWQIDPVGGVSTPPTVVDGIVYFGTKGNDSGILQGTAFAVDASDGQQLWQTVLGWGTFSAPAVDDNHVYIESRDKNHPFYALNKADGSTVWEYQPLDFKGNATVTNGTVYVTGWRDDNRVAALDSDTGSEEWTISPQSDIKTSPAISGDILCFGTTDGVIRAVDSNTGANKWSVDTENTITADPAIINNILYICDHGGTIHALDIDTGEMQFQQQVSQESRLTPPIIVDELLVTGDEEGTIHALQSGANPGDPAPDWTVEGFETGSLEDWNNVDTAKITSSRAYAGQKSLEITDQQDDGIGNKIHLPVVSSPPSQVGAALLIDDGSWNSVIYYLTDDNGDKIHDFRIHHRENSPIKDIYYGGNDNVMLRSNVSAYEWYYIELVDIQWDESVIGEIRVNGEVEATNVAFLNNGSSVSEVSLYVHDGGTGSKGYFDNVSIGVVYYSYFEVSPPVPTVDQEVTFDASPTEGEVESFEWAFGDGTTATGEVVTHTYNSIGTYEVTLTVDRPDGTDSTTRTVDVGEEDDKGDAGVTAEFDYSPQQVDPGEDVTVDASPSSGEIDEFVWAFGDGETADGVTSTHTYDEPGEYEITLQVLAVPTNVNRDVKDGQFVAPTDLAEAGTTDDEPVVVDTATATVLVESPDTIGFSVSELEPVTNETVQFTADASDTDDLMWDFDDGTTAQGSTASHQYDQSGVYSVTLTADGDTTSKDLTVGEPPVEVESIDRDIDGTLLPKLGLDEQFEAAVTTAPGRNLDYVEFQFNDQTATSDGPPYDAAFPVTDLDAPAEPLTVRAFTTDGALHERDTEVPVQSLPGWLEFLLDVVSDSTVELDGDSIDITYSPLANLAASVGIPANVIGGDDGSEEDGDGAYDLGVGFGGTYNTQTNQAELTASGDVGADVLALQFDIGTELTGQVDAGTLELLSVLAEIESSIEFDIEPPTVPVPISIPIPLTNASIGVVPTIIVTADGTFEFTDELDFDEGTVEPGIALEVALGISLPGWIPVSGELVGVPSGGVNGAFDVGTEDWNVEATFYLAGEIILNLPIADVNLGIDPIWEVPLVGGDAEAIRVATAGETRVIRRSAGGSQPLPGIDSVDAVGSPTESPDLRETFRLTDRPYEDTDPAVTSLDETTQLVVWSQQDENKPAEAGHDIVARWYENGEWGEPFTLVEDLYSHSSPVCTAAGSGEILVAWRTVETDLVNGGERLDTVAAVDELRDESELSYVVYDGEWGTPQTLTDTDRVERTPTVAATDGGWLLAWEQLERETEATTVRSTVVSPDGSNSGTVDRPESTAPDAGTRSDGQADLVYLGRDEDLGGVTHEIIADGPPDESVSYSAPDAVDAVASHGRVIWLSGSGRSPELTEVADGNPGPLSLREDVREIHELSLSGRDGEAALSYISHLGGSDNRNLVYRLNRGEGWIYDRSIAGESEETLRLRYTDLEFVGPGAFMSVYSLRNPGMESVSDVFATRQEFGPAYSIDGEVEPGVAGTETTLSYTLRNRGDEAGTEPVTVTITSDGEELVSTTHDPLGSDDSLEVMKSVVVGDTGRFDVSIEVPEPSLGPEPGSVELVAASADLRVDVVTAIRTGPEEAVVTVAIENAGGAVATTVPIVLADAADVVATPTVGSIEPGATETVDVPVDPTALDTSDTHTVSIDPEGTLPETTQTEESRLGYLVRPSLGVEEIRYRSDDEGPFARILVSNRGPGDGTARMELLDGSGELRAAPDIEISPAETIAGEQTVQYRELDVRLPQLETGETVEVEIVPEVSNLRQEALTRVDTVETILPGEFDTGPELSPLPGFDTPPQDIDDDGLYEDVDGDGEFDIFDVQALFNGLNSDAVQNNPEAFNFNGDEDPDEVDIFDVQALFNDL